MAIKVPPTLTENYISPLLESGFLTVTTASKNDPHVEYVTTDEGHELVAITTLSSLLMPDSKKP